MADIVKDTTDYRIKQIEIAEEKYYKTLIATLDRIEQEVTALANKELPQTDGKLIELQAAIAIRPKIKAIIDREYLAWSDTVVREGFTKQAVSSGIALQTEFELLNARLSEKADNLQIAEEQLFKLYAIFQNTKFDGEINYPDSFNIRDYASDLVYFQQAKSLDIGSSTYSKEVDKEIARAVVDDDEKLNDIFNEIDQAKEVGQFTQDEPAQEDQEVEQEEI